MRIERLGRGRRRGQVECPPRDSGPSIPADGVGIVGMGHRRHEAGRAACPFPRAVSKMPARVVDHLLVEIELVGADAGARLHHRKHVVVPARPVARPVPIRRPAEVGRIDVGGEPLLEAVELVGAAEMHLARQDVR